MPKMMFTECLQCDKPLVGPDHEDGGRLECFCSDECILARDLETLESCLPSDPYTAPEGDSDNRNPIDTPHYNPLPGETSVTLGSYYVRVSPRNTDGKYFWIVGWMGQPIPLIWGSAVDSVKLGTAAGLQQIRSGEARLGLQRCSLELNRFLASGAD